MSLRWWTFEGGHVGQASCLPSNDLQSQGGTPALHFKNLKAAGFWQYTDFGNALPKVCGAFHRVGELYPSVSGICSTVRRHEKNSVFSSKRQMGFKKKMERVEGIEPSWPAWKAGTLPLSYTRLRYFINLHKYLRLVNQFFSHFTFFNEVFMLRKSSMSINVGR